MPMHYYSNSCLILPLMSSNPAAKNCMRYLYWVSAAQFFLSATIVKLRPGHVIEHVSLCFCRLWKSLTLKNSTILSTEPSFNLQAVGTPVMSRTC